MGLTDRLRDLDQRILPGTRDDDEDAEAYLRRVAASRAISPAQAGDVMAALRVYFDVEPAVGESDDQDEDKDDDDADEETSEEPKDEANEEQADNESKSESDDESADESKEKSEDED